MARTLILLVLLQAVACKDDLPGALDTSSQMTVLKSIKILNAGPNGNEVIQGTVNETTKIVSFPRIDPETDFSAIRFEVELSDGAKLDKDSYTVTFEEGKSEQTIVIKVLNEPRYREYFVRFRLLVPLFGADFEKVVVYDYSTNPAGNPAYPSFSGLNTRGTGFDGEHVLVLDRGAAGAHILRVSDLKQNKIERIPLNMTGVAGGTYPYNMGAIVNGHIYAASLSTSGTNPLRVYHWADPAQAPDVVVNILPGTIPGTEARHGDNVSFNLDNNGNGYVYFIPATGTKVLRLKIANFTELTETTVVTAPSAYLQWSSYLQVGNTDNYLATGNTLPISVVNAAGTASYTMGTSSIPNNGADARIIEFNGERYLLMVTVARSSPQVATIYLYDITRGNTVAEALSLLDQSGSAAVYEHNLTGTPNGAPAAQTGWKIIKDEEGNDEKLVIYGAHTDGGFAIIEVPKKSYDDE